MTARWLNTIDTAGREKRANSRPVARAWYIRPTSASRVTRKFGQKPFGPIWP